jgi:hypothetical protein
VPTKPERRFTLLDAMILVAATAVGIALSKAWPGPETYEVSLAIFGPKLLRSLGPVTHRIIASWPIVAIWTAALIALRLRRPRPASRRLFAPPGIAACVVALVVMLLKWLECGGYVVLHNDWVRNVRDISPLSLSRVILDATASPVIGYGVAAVWASLALARRWRPEPGWIDRAGRVVGLLWIVLIPIRFHFDRCFPSFYP